MNKLLEDYGINLDKVVDLNKKAKRFELDKTPYANQIKQFNKTYIELSLSYDKLLRDFNDYETTGQVGFDYNDDLSCLQENALDVFNRSCYLIENLEFKGYEVDSLEIFNHNFVFTETTENNITYITFNQELPHHQNEPVTKKLTEFRYIMEQTYLSQIKPHKNKDRYDKCYISVEHYSNKIKRDIDNYDEKKLTDLVAYTHLLYGDKADKVRRLSFWEHTEGEAYTRVAVIKPEYIMDYITEQNLTFK